MRLREQTGDILKVRTHRLSNGWIIQSSKSREMMRWHFAAGQISGCQQKLNGRLPRKVVQRMTYIHGDRFLAGEDYHCNIWQGAFPKANTKADGFASTAPARFYEPNGYGLYQVIGNVWEWCSNPARIPLEQFRSWDSHF